jgi:hypothetical protein
VVRRSSGKNTVWVNGAPVPEGRSAVGPAPRISGRNPGVVILRSGRRGSTSIRVGETLDLRPDPSEASPTGPNAQAGGRAGKSRE